jgi:hypothetical protein
MNPNPADILVLVLTASRTGPIEAHCTRCLALLNSTEFDTHARKHGAGFISVIEER